MNASSGIFFLQTIAEVDKLFFTPGPQWVLQFDQGAIEEYGIYGICRKYK